jgi:hypothetical protein
VVRVDRGCNVDRKFDLARLMELLGEQPSLTWLELDASEVHRDANCPQRERSKPGATDKDDEARALCWVRKSHAASDWPFPSGGPREPVTGPRHGSIEERHERRRETARRPSGSGVVRPTSEGLPGR